MNRLADEMPIRASLLDRLQDHSNDHAVRAGRQNLSDLIQSVHEHLEALLNTRWRAVGGGDGQDELKRSLINYGIPDFATTSVASPEGQARFQNLVTEAIRLHEPRFLDVKVEIIETDATRRSIHFRIQGELHAQPEPALVAFDSMLDPADQRIRVNTFNHV